ncbi:MAG: hypothetical protein AAGE94_19665 [Acidobacteriota bacterium]
MSDDRAPDVTMVRIELDELPPAGLRLHLDRVRWTDASFQLWAFLNLPDERLVDATLDDPCFADLFTMYGAGDRADRALGEIFLDAVLTLRRAVIERVGRVDANVVTLMPRDIDGAPLRDVALEIGHLRVEPLTSR